MSFVFDIAAAQQASALGKYNQSMMNRNAQVKEQEAQAIKQQTEFDIAKFDRSYQQLVGQTKVASAVSGAERSGSVLNVLRYNAEQAETEKDVLTYNSQVAQSQKMEEANFARIQGNIARQQARITQFGFYAKAGESLLRIGSASGYSFGGDNQGVRVGDMP
tara:strand:- start:96 stop:581 length:486 start_codon:yes stop_codon:yes gene_type:complete